MRLRDAKPSQRVRLADGREYIVSAPCGDAVWARAVVAEGSPLVRCRDRNDTPLGEIEVVGGDQLVEVV